MSAEVHEMPGTVQGAIDMIDEDADAIVIVFRMPGDDGEPLYSLAWSRMTTAEFALCTAIMEREVQRRISLDAQ